MNRPFDSAMTHAMIETCSALVEHFHARIGYTQSDEIGLVWLFDGECQDPLFGGRVQKLCSVLAGYATAAFTAACLRDRRLREDYLGRMPHFDCRVLSLPDKTEAANMLLWREQDAYRNAVSMLAQSRFSHKQLHGQGRADMLRMLTDVDVDFEALPQAFKRGTFLQRVSFERAFTAEELAAIPTAHRPAPDALITRSEVRPLAIERFGDVADREAVVFDGALAPLAPVDDTQRLNK
jgi:tRNA(His) 5'-end guanylyltransferase